jgi:hypothetical protein
MSKQLIPNGRVVMASDLTCHLTGNAGERLSPALSGEGSKRGSQRELNEWAAEKADTGVDEERREEVLSAFLYSPLAYRDLRRGPFEARSLCFE